MATFVDFETFLRDLRQSEALPDKAVAEIAQSPNYQGLSAEELAPQLVHDKKISAFQASCLLQGRWRDLIYGDYRAVRILHIGGIGFILLARKKNEPGWFAIKALKQNMLAEQAMVDMFRLEAHAMTTLRHPNIVRGLHYGPCENDSCGHFLAMEFIAGPNLGELVAISRDFTWQQACDVIAQSARGLQHAHEQNFLHRDVKPGNIIVDRNGVAKLVDFGFATYTGPQPIFPAAADRRPGTAAFVAPERLIGDKSHSFPADVYSLGMTFYFTLTGREPFPGRRPKDILRAQVKEQPQSILELVPQVPLEVVQIFERMTAKLPSERFANMVEVAEALEPFAERRPVELDLRALLQARSKTHSRDDIQALTTPGSVLNEPETTSLSSKMSLSGLSNIQQLETGVRRIADELATQRAENQRLLDLLEVSKSDRRRLQAVQTELRQLRLKSEQFEVERANLTAEADRSRQTIADLTARCNELEGTIDHYRAQLDKMLGRMKELAAAVADLQKSGSSQTDAKEALRSAYENAGPLSVPGNDGELLDEIWADEEFFDGFQNEHKDS